MLRFLKRAGGALIPLLVVWAQHSYAVSPPDIQKIKEKGKLTIGLVHYPDPPFFMRDSQGQWYGLDIDLAKRISTELGVKLEIVDTAKSFDEVVEQVEARKIDMAISNISSNLRRAQKVAFTKPYITLNHAILINRIKNFDLNKEDLNSVVERMNQPTSTIGVLKGSSYVDYAKHDYPKAKLIILDTPELLFESVTNGNVMFAVRDESDVRNWIHSRPESSIRVKVMLNKSRKDPVAIAVAWDQEHLLNWLNLVIDVMNYDGSFEKLKKYYLEGFEWTKKK